MKKAYSINSEDFNYTDAGEALQALAYEDRLVEGHVYYECDCEEVPFTRYLRADRILDIAGDDMFDEVGEAAEDAFLVGYAAQQELNALLANWAKKHLSGTYWRCIGKPREITVTSADITMYAA